MIFFTDRVISTWVPVSCLSAYLCVVPPISVRGVSCVVVVRAQDLLKVALLLVTALNHF